ATQVRGRLPTYPFFTSTAPVFSKAVIWRESTESETPRESRSSRNSALSRFFRLETMPSRVGLVRSGSSRARESPRWGIDSWSSEAGGLFFAVISCPFRLECRRGISGAGRGGRRQGPRATAL